MQHGSEVATAGVLHVAKPAPISRVRKVTSYLSVTHSEPRGSVWWAGGYEPVRDCAMGLVPVVVAGCWSQCPARRPGRLRGW
jgi:hypothetical protein